MCRQGESFEEYYIRADKALYYVKQNGKNNYRFYEELEEQQPDAQKLDGIPGNQHDIQ